MGGGRFSHGPLPVVGEDIPGVDPAAVQRSCPWMFPEDCEEIGGLIGRFNGRARRVLFALLEGKSLAQASAIAVIGRDTLDNWRRNVQEFGYAVTLCHDLGSALYEGELHSRALAGPDDRGSMRALELVVKARNPDYRDKAQVQMGVIHVFKQALSDAGGWRGEALPERVVDADS